MMLAMQAKGQRGAMAIETALLFPLLVLLLFGMLEGGLWQYNRQMITNASREGARFGIVLDTPRPTAEAIEGVVNDYCEDYLVTFGSAPGPSTDIVVTEEATGAETPCVGSSCCVSFQDGLEVRVTYQYEFLVLSNFGFDPIDLRARTRMRCE